MVFGADAGLMSSKHVRAAAEVDSHLSTGPQTPEVYAALVSVAQAFWACLVTVVRLQSTKKTSYQKNYDKKC